MLDSLKEICFNYINKVCSKERIKSWQECSLFCLPFKIYEQIKVSTFYFCICEPFLCKEKCSNPEHEILLYCCNCKINGECTSIKGHNQHCIVYDWNTYVFEDNLEEICTKLTKSKNNTLELYHTLNGFFTLLHCYKGFGQPDKEKYGSVYDHLNLKLPGIAFCKCWWSLQSKILIF